VHALWQKLQDQGWIYKGCHEGWYSVSDETFYPENQVCDAISSDGHSIKVSVETQKPVDWIKEENYMFRLKEFRQPLIQWLEAHPRAVVPKQRHSEVLMWLKADEGHFHDLSISRPSHRQSWGIRVPGDESQTIYVWLDALANYLTVCGYNKSQTKLDGFPFRTHVIGKDILRFHAMYWPAFLMAAGLPLPQQIVAHGHWTVDHVKMSKSLGNVVDPFQLMKAYPVDAVRYFLLRDGALNADGDFSEDFLRMRYQVELVNHLGNLLARCLNPVFHDKVDTTVFKLDKDDEQLLDQARKLVDVVDPLYMEGDFSHALTHVNRVVSSANQYITRKEPWKTIKQADTRADAQKVIHLCSKVLASLGVVLYPVMPSVCEVLLDRLNVVKECRNASDISSLLSAVADINPIPGKFILLPRLK
jgi:methionyl-tRNA synthetase